MTSSYAQQLYDTPCTQNAINIVKRDICEIETMSILHSKSKSFERQQIIILSTQVHGLKRKLKEQALKIDLYEGQLFGNDLHAEKLRPMKTAKILVHAIHTLK